LILKINTKIPYDQYLANSSAVSTGKNLLMLASDLSWASLSLEETASLTITGMKPNA